MSTSLVQDEDSKFPFSIKPVLQNNMVSYNDDLIILTTTNTILGKDAAQRITTGTSNTVIGNDTGLSLTTGSKNTLVGEAAGSSLLQGSENVFIGYEAGSSVTSGTSNTLLGFQAGSEVSTGSNNTLLGYQAGEKITTASNNICIGKLAGSNITIGDNASPSVASDNVFIGNSSGDTITNQSYNTLIGSGTDSNFSNTIALGYRAESLAANSMYLPKNPFFTTQTGYGTTTMTNFNSYDCSLKYNKTTGQVVIKEGDDIKPTLTNYLLDDNISSAITLPSKNNAKYHITMGAGFNANFTIYLPPTSSISDGFACKIFLLDLISTKTLTISASASNNPKLNGNLTVLSVDGDTTAELGRGIISKSNLSYLFFGNPGGPSIKTPSYISFEYINGSWFFDGTLYLNSGDATNLTTFKNVTFNL